MGGTATAAAMATMKAKEVYDYNKERKKAGKNLVGLKTQKNMEINAAKNLLEENLAQQKARISSMGLVNSSSALAAKKRFNSDAQKDIAKIGYNYGEKERAVKESFRDKHDNFVYAGLLDAGKYGSGRLNKNSINLQTKS